VSKTSAGILLYKVRDGRLLVFLVHPGGPLWARRDTGSWSIPKGVFEEPEEPLTAARREFREETGFDLPDGTPRALAPQKQPSGKVVHAWAVEGDVDPKRLRSNTFAMEWPRGSGRQREFPEVDRGEWFDLEEARRRILPGQAPFLDEVLLLVAGHG
jgi:predicted NUDIX family NTP pyrophosphohydrolase